MGIDSKFDYIPPLTGNRHVLELLDSRTKRIHRVSKKMDFDVSKTSRLGRDLDPFSPSAGKFVEIHSRLGVGREAGLQMHRQAERLAKARGRQSRERERRLCVRARRLRRGGPIGCF